MTAGIILFGTTLFQHSLWAQDEKTAQCFSEKLAIHLEIEAGTSNVWVTRKQSSGIFTRTDYIRTDRGIKEIEEEAKDGDEIYPPHYLDLRLLANKRVLDLGSGERGWLVRDLLADPKYNIRAVGIDLAPIHDKNRGRDLVQGDAAHLPFANQSFDVVFCTWSLFTEMYASGESSVTLTQVLREVHRVLKVGGVFRTGPEIYLTGMNRMIAQIPGLELKEVNREAGYVKSVELIRTH